MTTERSTPTYIAPADRVPAWATEETLKSLRDQTIAGNKLLYQIAALTGAEKKELDKITKGTAALKQSMDDVADSVEEGTKESQRTRSDVVKTLGKIGDGLGRGFSTIAQGISSLDPSKVFKGVGTGAKDLGQTFQSLAADAGKFSVLGTSLTALGGTINMLVGLGDRVLEFNSQYMGLIASGIRFQNGLDGLNDAVSASGLTLGEYTKIVNKYGSSFAQLGSKNIAAASKSLLQLTANGSSLNMTLPEVQEGLMQYADILRVSGRLTYKNSAEIAAGATTFLHNIDDLSRLSGQSRDALIKSTRDAMADPMVQAAMINMSEKQIENITAGMGQLGALTPEVSAKLRGLATVFSQAGLSGAMLVDENMRNAVAMTGSQAQFENLMTAITQGGDVKRAMELFVGQIKASGVSLSAFVSPNLKGAGQTLGELVLAQANYGQAQSEASATTDDGIKTQQKLNAAINNATVGLSRLRGEFDKVVTLGMGVPAVTTSFNLLGDALAENGPVMTALDDFANKLRGLLDGLDPGMLTGLLLGGSVLASIVGAVGSFMITKWMVGGMARSLGIGAAAKGPVVPGMIELGKPGFWATLTKGFKMMAKPLGLAATGISAVLAGADEYQKTGNIGKAATVGVSAGVGTFVGGALGSFLGPVGTLVGAQLGSMLGEWVGGGLYDWFASGDAGRLLKSIGDFFKPAIDVIVGVGKGFVDVITDPIGSLVRFFNTIKDTALSAAQGLLNGLAEIGSNIAKFFAGMLGISINESNKYNINPKQDTPQQQLGLGGMDTGEYDPNYNETHRAAGGPVKQGQGYIVGEKGPEWFQPEVSGFIHPNNTLQDTYDGPIPHGVMSNISPRNKRQARIVLENFNKKKYWYTPKVIKRAKELLGISTAVETPPMPRPRPSFRASTFDSIPSNVGLGYAATRVGGMPAGRGATSARRDPMMEEATRQQREAELTIFKWADQQSMDTIHQQELMRAIVNARHAADAQMITSANAYMMKTLPKREAERKRQKDRQKFLLADAASMSKWLQIKPEFERSVFAAADRYSMTLLPKTPQEVYDEVYQRLIKLGESQMEASTRAMEAMMNSRGMREKMDKSLKSGRPMGSRPTLDYLPIPYSMRAHYDPKDVDKMYTGIYPDTAPGAPTVTPTAQPIFDTGAPFAESIARYIQAHKDTDEADKMATLARKGYHVAPPENDTLMKIMVDGMIDALLGPLYELVDQAKQTNENTGKFNRMLNKNPF